MSETLPDVYAAIAAVSDELAQTGIAKTRRNQQQGYEFRGIDDVYNALAPVMAKRDLVVIPRILSRTLVERQTKTGNVLFNVVVEAEFDFVSARDGSKVTARSFGEAMDSADKATNKAMSAAYKYTAFQTFCIPTEGDNDADGQTPEEVITPERESQIAQQLRASLQQPKPAPPKQTPKPPKAASPNGTPTGLLRVQYAKVAKEGVNDKGPWTLYAVRFIGGLEGTTFSKSIFEAAKDAAQSGRLVDAVIVDKKLKEFTPIYETGERDDEPPF